MTIFDTIIEQAGTKAQVAKWCGVSKTAVGFWFRDGRIPPDHWHVFIKRVPGVTASRLYREFYGKRAA